MTALANALGLSAHQRATFEAAARGHDPAPAIASVLAEQVPGRRSASLPIPPTPLVGREDDVTVLAARTILGDERFAAAWAQGEAMPLEQAISYRFDE